MRRHSLYIGALTALVLLAPAATDARMHHPARGHRILASGSALDTFAVPSSAHSFRKLRSAYAGPAVKLQRVDTTTQDIGFVGADFDVAAAAAFCTTACTVQTFYDQVGTRHLVQATAASQPAYVANCQGSLPCARTTAAQSITAAGNFTPATGVMSLNMVMRRTVGTNCSYRINGTNSTILGTVGAPFSLTNSGGTINATADTAWHSLVGIANTTSSALNVDGVSTAGTVGNVVTPSLYQFFGIAATTCDVGELMFWDNVVLTPAQISTLTANQQQYWMPYALDSFTAPSGAYSFRKLKSSYAGPAIRIRRASDNAELDINFLGFVPGLGAPWDEAAAAAHCAATSCFLVTWYDQSGNARHLMQATPANQPALVFNCKGALPCAELTSGTQTMAGPSVTPATGVATLNMVANRAVGTTGQCAWIRQSGTTGNRTAAGNLANNWVLVGAAGSIFTGLATDAVWHSGIAVFNGATSQWTIDGTDGTPAAITNGTAAGTVQLVGAGTTTCRQGEIIAWDTTVLSGGEKTALTSNQRGFWGTP